MRVKNGSCELHGDIQKLTTHCYDSYSRRHEDKLPFGLESLIEANNETANGRRNATIRNVTHSSETA